MTIQETAQTIAAILDSKKGIDIEVIDVKGKTTLADYFVIASGSSVTQVKAMADEVVYVLSKEHQMEPDHVEGNNRDHWILLDYLDVVVHIFLEAERHLYSLEKLWSGQYQRPVPEAD